LKVFWAQPDRFQRPDQTSVTTERYAVITTQIARREQRHGRFLSKTRWVVGRNLS